MNHYAKFCQSKQDSSNRNDRGRNKHQTNAICFDKSDSTLSDSIYNIKSSCKNKKYLNLCSVCNDIFDTKNVGNVNISMFGINKKFMIDTGLFINVIDEKTFNSF